MCTSLDYDSFTIKKRKLDIKELELCSREDLIRRIVQLEDHVTQLRNIITKRNLSSQEPKRVKRSLDFTKCAKRHIAIKLLYLGWEHDGFVQQEDSLNTIEYHLFEALKNGCLIENRETSNYHRCGRTDRGVSSFSQVISLTVRSKLMNPSINNVENELPYCKILNTFLPKSIRAISWSPVPNEFSARFSCLTRTYKYWFPRGDLNIEKMNEAVQNMIGTYDFRNLCKMDISNGVTNFVRTIDSGNVSVCSTNSLLNESGYDMCTVTLTSSSFLWHQIRCIVNVLFLIGQNKEDTSIITKLLDINSCPKKPQYALADSMPLNLFHCEYENINWITDEYFSKDVFQTLQSCWAVNSVKCIMLEEMMKHCRNYLTNNTSAKQYAVFFNDVLSKVYKPLLFRPTGRSLTDGISHFLKKGRIERSNSGAIVDSNKINMLEQHESNSQSTTFASLSQQFNVVESSESIAKISSDVEIAQSVIENSQL